MQRKINTGNFLFYDSMPWVRLGLEAYLQPAIIHSNQVGTLHELSAALEQNPNQTVVMELYSSNERLYEGVRFILQAKEFWPKTAWMVFTDVENYSIVHLLAAIPRISLVSKRDELECVLNGITSARYGLGYHSPNIQRIMAVRSLPAPVKGLSSSEWQVLALMISGFSAQNIADNTQRTYKTVSCHKLNILRKLCFNQADFILMLLAFRRRSPVSIQTFH
jgi:two-component system capsular synthesis response regulator RcsB